MRLFAAIVACLLSVRAARGESLTVTVAESAVIEIAGATAAYTTNPAIAEVATASTGRLSITGQSAGTTQLIVITPLGTQSFLITVITTAHPAAHAPDANAPLARYEGRYSSGIARVQNAVDVVTTDGARRSEFSILHLHDLDRIDRPADSIASIFYRRTTPGRELTLLDAMVDASHMTISNTEVRGMHLRQGALELHAGYASSSMYDGFYLHADRRWVAGAGYDFGTVSTRWTPSVYGFFSEPRGSTARRGVVGALSVEHRRGDSLFIRGDLGISGSLAASSELRRVTSRDQLRVFMTFKPDNFPTLGLAEIPGAHATIDWYRRQNERLSLTSYGTFDRFRLTSQSQTIGAASSSLQYLLARHLAVLTGADVSVVRTAEASIRTIGVPIGMVYDAASFGFAATYRMLDNSEASRRGDTLRVSARTGRGRFSSSVWAERQRQAPTLDLIFNADPGLELALLRLGISVRTPEDVGRALRDNAALINLGFITGVNVNLTPRRLQAGINLGWLGTGARSDHLRLLTVYGRDEGIGSTRENLLSTLTYSRRILTATDLFGSYSWWRTKSGSQAVTGGSIEIGLRQQFNGLPSFLRRGGTIEGFVFLDPEMRGARGETTRALEDVTVTLDGNRKALTDARGAYRFEKVPAGPHRLAAQLPSTPRSFFTTPSHAETDGAAHVDFGIVWAAGRIDGRVMNDAGAGIENVVLSATAKTGPPISATSDADGRFVFAVPPGTFRISFSPDTLPDGYSPRGSHEQSVTVEADAPQSVSFELLAQRSVAGRAVGASEVRIDSLGRIAHPDATGNFVFRSMPSGTFTITARIDGRNVSANVTLPSGPAMIRDVVLAMSSARMP